MFLAYEDEFYAEMSEKLPRVNSRVKTKQGAIGKVRGVNALKETVLLEIEMEEGETYIEVTANEVEPVTDKSKAKRKKR